MSKLETIKDALLAREKKKDIIVVRPCEGCDTYFESVSQKELKIEKGGIVLYHVNFRVSPTGGPYSEDKFNELLNGLVPDMKPDATIRFSRDCFHNVTLGRLGYREDIGEFNLGSTYTDGERAYDIESPLMRQRMIWTNLYPNEIMANDGAKTIDANDWKRYRQQFGSGRLWKRLKK